MAIKKHLNFTSLRRTVSEVFNNISDWRQKGKVTISIHDAMLSGFACMYFQDPSLLQFQQRMQEEQHQNNLRTFFDVQHIPKETQMRRLLIILIVSILDQFLETCIKNYNVAII
jgi:hypothetical protein